MTEPGPPPRWRALEIGPGGLPADEVRPIGRGPAPDQGAAGPRATSPAADETHAAPVRAALGSFDDEPRRPSGRARLGWLMVAVAVAVVVGLALWSNSARPLGGSGELGTGDCLSSRGGLSVIPVDCGSTDVEFQVVARYEDTTNSSRCVAVSSDVVLVTRDSAVLCLNYVADVGDCLYAGSSGGEVGKAACGTAGSGSAAGLYRVLAVLRDTIDDRDCPRGTVHSLVHPTSAEVLCLGRP